MLTPVNAPNRIAQALLIQLRAIAPHKLSIEDSSGASFSLTVNGWGHYFTQATGDDGQIFWICSSPERSAQRPTFGLISLDSLDEPARIFFIELDQQNNLMFE